MPDGRPLKILVIGCGSIGRRHIRLLKEMGVDAYGFDVDLTTCHKVMDELGVLPYRGYLGEVLASRFDGAIIATPNHLHREPSEECLRAGLPVLIEKPMCHTLEEADVLELLHRVRPHPLLVGYCLRHHVGPTIIKEAITSGRLGTIRHASVWCSSFLPSWRPGMNYRTGYACKKETGGGVLLDSSHELDLCNWWFGEPRKVQAMIRNTGALDGLETEDVADVLIEYASGTQVSVHLDYLSQEYRRGCAIVGDKETLQFEFLADGRYMNQIGARVNQEMRATDRDEMYRRQLRHFLACIRGEEQPLVTGADGIRALLLVEAARRSSDQGRTIQL